MTQSLPRRQQEILDLLHRLGAATVGEVRASMAAPPSYSAVRAMLRILEEKGHVLHVADGPRFVYGPIESQNEAAAGALRHVVNTFFAGSITATVVALNQLDVS